MAIYWTLKAWCLFFLCSFHLTVSTSISNDRITLEFWADSRTSLRPSCSISTKFGTFRQTSAEPLVTVPQLLHTEGRTDREPDMANLVGKLLLLLTAKAPKVKKKGYSSPKCLIRGAVLICKRATNYVWNVSRATREESNLKEKDREKTVAPSANTVNTPQQSCAPPAQPPLLSEHPQKPERKEQPASRIRQVGFSLTFRYRASSV